MDTPFRPTRRFFALLAGGLTGLAAQAQGIEPYKAQEVKPYRAQEVKPHQAEPSRPEGARQDRSAPVPPPRQDASFFFRTFGLAVPGVAYSWDNLATQTRTNVVAAGTTTKSTIRIDPEGTYVWNSAWDGRVIQGRWVSHRDGILLQHGQEKKDWVMGRLPNPSGTAVVYLYDGNYMTYHGTPRPTGR